LIQSYAAGEWRGGPDAPESAESVEMDDVVSQQKVSAKSCLEALAERHGLIIGEEQRDRETTTADTKSFRPKKPHEGSPMQLFIRREKTNLRRTRQSSSPDVDVLRHTSAQIMPSSLMRGSADDFKAEMPPRVLPSTKNEPYSFLLVDMGATNRLFLTSCDFTAEAGYMRSWLLQGSNDPLAGEPPVSNDAAADDAEKLARTIADLRWITLSVFEPQPRKRASGRVTLRTKPMSSLNSIAAARAGTPLAGAFRFFRIVLLSPNEGRPGELFCLSLSKLRFFGGLVSGVRRADNQTSLLGSRRSTSVDPRSVGKEQETDDGDSSADEAKQEHEILAESAAKLGDPHATLFKAVLSSIEFNSEATREAFQRRLDHQLSVLSKRQRAIELTVEYIRDHQDISDYDFVFEGTAE
jgi:hypothetical protein